jgi:serine/threonine protein kinase
VRGADLIGQTIDRRYQILERIAEGAMGVVYRGVRLKLDRAVAIKIMHAALPSAMGAKKRFEREAKLMARLEHPHIVTILDFGVHDDKPYVVMELVRGRSLHEMLVEQGRFEIPRAVDILRQVLSGLAHAHDHGIIHRDIKPANIMTTPKAPLGVHARILDFGLACVMGDSKSLSEGVAVGTPSYMSPEQCRGDELDPRVDIYACGVVLFEMLTGKKPFASEDPLDIVRKHLHEKPPQLGDVVPGDYGAFDDVIARALAKSPADRYPSAVAMAEALESAVGGTSAAGSTTALPLSSIPTDAPASVEIPITVGSSVRTPIPQLSSSALVVEESGTPAPVEDSSFVRQMLPVSRMRQFVLLALVLASAAVVGIVMLRRELAKTDPPVAKAPVTVTADAAVVPLEAPKNDPAADAVAEATRVADAGKVDKAIDMLLEARRRFPDRADIPAAAGKLYFSKLWWHDGIASLRDAIKLDPSLRKDPALLEVAVRGFITTPDYDGRLGNFVLELGPPVVPVLDEIARTHRNPQIRARAAAMQNRIR